MNPALVAGLASVSALVFLIVGVALGYWGNARLNSRAIKATEDALTQQIEQARTRSNEILKESQLRAEEFRKEIETERTKLGKANPRRERRDLQRIQRRIDRSAEELRTQQTDSSLSKSELQKELTKSCANAPQLNSNASPACLEGFGQETFFSSVRKTKTPTSSSVASAKPNSVTKTRPTNERRIILAASLQRLASDVVGEASVTSIPIPSEDVKGPSDRTRGSKHPGDRSQHWRRSIG